MTLEALQALLAEYQAILSLNEWDIRLGFVPRNEQVNAGRARGNFQENYRQAWIDIVPEEAQPPYLNGDSPDNEYDLVHELVHLRFWLSCGTNAVEWEVEAMARALVKLRRAAV